MLLYSFTQSLSGTSVVIVRTPQRVVIAADSLGKLNGKSVNMCKIVTHPRFSTVFAMAGIATTSRRFSAFDLAKSAIAINYGKMRATVEWFESKATIRIKTEMQRMRKEDPSEYKQALNRPEPFQIAFIGWDENIPTFTTIAFSLQESAGKVRVAYKESRCPGEGCPSGFTVTPLGANEAIVTALRSLRLLDYDLNANGCTIGQTGNYRKAGHRWATNLRSCNRLQRHSLGQ